MKVAFLLPLFALAACGAQHVNTLPAPPIIVPVEVKVPVAGGCVPDALGPVPDYVDTKDKLVAAADAAERMQLLYAGRAQRQARLNEIEPIIAACPRGTAK